MRLSSTFRWPAAVIVVAVTVLAWTLSRTDGDGDHRVVVAVASATSVQAGQQVREGGRSIGEITGVAPVRGGRAARLELRIDREAWPVRARDRLQLRWGGTVNYDNRYLALERGSTRAAAVTDGGTLPSRNFRSPVEFDSLVRTFQPAVRRSVKALTRRSSEVVERAPLGSAIDGAGPAVRQLDEVLAQLDRRPEALRALLRSSASVARAVDGAQPGVDALVRGATGTFDAIAGEADALRSTLDVAPSTLRTTRTSLGRLSATLTNVRRVTGRLDGGLDEVRQLTRPLVGALDTVHDVAPQLRSAINRTAGAAPDIDGLLGSARAVAPTLEGIGRQAAHELQCIRPYTPEIVSFFTNWGGFSASKDSGGHYFRFLPQVILGAATTNQGFTPAQALQVFPGMTYSFPNPPGWNAGQPWLLPECGAGKAAITAGEDPESRHWAGGSR
ncbi:MAG: MlaD family protein [Solirubrobacteraceae bacterium]